MPTKNASLLFRDLSLGLARGLAKAFTRTLALLLGALTCAMVFAVVFATRAYAADSIYLPMVSAPGALPSSETLINQAVQAGKIDGETALLYRVYANFEDPRLPAEYRGDDSGEGLNLVVREAQARLSTLSLETQALLAPFFLPPMDENSWHEARESSAQVRLAASSQPAATHAKIKWLTTCQTDPNIKVWYQERYPDDAASAHQVCELVRGEIWPRLVSLMGRRPLDDGGESNNGGDAQLDLYLVGANTATIGYRGCFNTPSYLYVNRTRWNKALLTSAVMGAFLNSYEVADCMEYSWLYAATTTWAIDHVYPQDQWEHNYADDFLQHADLPLNTYPIVPLEAQNKIGEGSYLWVWFAANMLKTPQETVPLWWQNATNPNSLAAVNGVMGEKGFEQEWKNFSGLNWNDEPVDVYKDLDSMPHQDKLMLDEEVVLNGAQDRTYEFDATVMTLAAHTYRFKFNDSNVRSVYFYNPFKDGVEPTADVTAYYKLQDGSWTIDTWTDKYGKGFCRDLIAERVEELVIVISNHEWQNRTHELEPAKPPRLNVTNVACRGWEFEGTATWVGTGEEYSVNDSATMHAIFMRQPFGDDSGSSSLDYFQVTEGSGSWSHTGHHVNCGGSASGTFMPAGGDNSGLFILSKATDHATSTEYVPGDRRYNGFAIEGTQYEKLVAPYTCKNGDSYDQAASSAHRWFLTEPLFEMNEMVSADGTTITGSYTWVEDDGFHVDTHTWEWTMTALPPE